MLAGKELEMPTPPAKISRPGPSGDVRRDRFIQLPHQSGFQLIFCIAGSPGLGKIAPAAKRLEARQIDSLWRQFNEEDADHANFFHRA
jgi:hypothetical protein